MKDCSECEYYKKLAQLWRDEAYEIKGHELSKEWVGLTNEQIVDLVIKNAGFPTKLVKAIEAMLKERNT